MVYLQESNFLFFLQFCFQTLSFLPNLKSHVAKKQNRSFPLCWHPFLVFLSLSVIPSFLDLQTSNSDLLSHPYSPQEFWSNYKINGLSLKHILYLSAYYNLLKKSPNEMGVSQKYAVFYLPCSQLHNQSSDAIFHKLGICFIFKNLCISIAYTSSRQTKLIM